MYSIKRIIEMEELFDRINQILLSPDFSLKQLHQIDDQITQLEAYYTSPAWKEDFDADCHHLLPPELKRGVLSEDGIDHLLDTYSSFKRELID